MDDRILPSLARRCPRCGDAVFRHLGAWQQVLFFLPFHLGQKTVHRCMGCSAEYVSRSTASDYLLSAGFVSVHWLLGSWWWISLLFLAIWLVFTLIFRWRGVVGPIHTFIAAFLIAVLWFVALAVTGTIPRHVVARFGNAIFGGATILGFLCSYLLLWIDKRAAPRLESKRADDTPSGSSGAA